MEIRVANSRGTWYEFSPRRHGLRDLLAMEHNEAAASSRLLAVGDTYLNRLNNASGVNLSRPASHARAMNGDSNADFTVQRAAANSVELQLNSTYAHDA